MEKTIGEHFGKDTPTALRLMRMPRVLNKLRGLYNKLCPDCQNKVVKNPKMPLSDYCLKCRPEAGSTARYLEKVLK